MIVHRANDLDGITKLVLIDEKNSPMDCHTAGLRPLLSPCDDASTLSPLFQTALIKAGADFRREPPINVFNGRPRTVTVATVMTCSHCSETVRFRLSLDGHSTAIG